MSAVFEQSAIQPVETDDWQPVSVPIEDDPFFTSEEVERIRLKDENSDPKRRIAMSFDQLYAIMEVLKK